MMRKSLWIIAVLLLLAASGAPAAHADMITFKVSGQDTGNITITETAGVISAISGTFDGSTIGALIAPGGIGGNDNIYTGINPFFDSSGVSFTLDTTDSKGFTDVNLSNNSSPPTIAFGSCQGDSPIGGVYCNGAGSLGAAFADTITRTSVPEIDPTSATTPLVLLVGAVMIIRGRRRKLAQPESGCERV